MRTLDDDEMEDIGRTWSAIRLIWTVQIALLFVLVIIAHVVGDTGIRGEGADDVLALVGYTLYVLGALLLVIAYATRRAVRDPGSRLGRIADSGYRSARTRYMTVFIFSSSMVVSVGIYGLIIFMINYNYASLYLLVGLAFVAQLYLRPKKQEIVDLAFRLKEEDRAAS